MEHKLIHRLMPRFLNEIAEAEAEAAEINGTLRAGQPAEDEDEAADEEAALSEAEVRELKRKLTAAKKRVKQLRQSFVERLEAARKSLTAKQAQELVLDILETDLQRALDRAVTEQRQLVVAAFENWWDKYRIPLREIEAQRDRTAARLDGFLRELGYG